MLKRPIDIIDEGNKGIAGNILTFLSREMAHLLKFKYQPTAQTGSWVASIIDSCAEINEMANKSALAKITAEEFERCYQSSRRKAIAETGLPAQAFPSENPYSINNLISMNWVVATLNNQAIDDKIRDKIKEKVSNENIRKYM